MSRSETELRSNHITDAKRRAITVLWSLYLLRRRMGGFLDKPNTEKSREQGGGNGLRYGVASMQGWRVEMEDAHSTITALPGEFKDWSFFAVFDGHCGSRVSAHCAQHLLPTITQTEDFKDLESRCGGDEAPDAVPSIERAIHTGFLKLDETMRQLPEVSSGEDKSGSTAVCALISPSHIYIANCGDSRGVLCRKGVAAVSTHDHKPNVPAEKDRIQKAGGSVMIQRVNGSLAVSRALGDFEYKSVEGRGPTEQLVSPAPEIFVEGRNVDEDEFLILACDGIWDVMTNEDACKFIRHQLTVTDDLAKICTNVIDLCLVKGSRDNMSIVLVAFPSAPKPTAEAVETETKLDSYIEERTLELLKNDASGDMDTNRVLHVLSQEEIPGLASTVKFDYLGAKRSLIETVIESSKATDSSQGGQG